jgi:hypothetical protein
LRIATWLGLAVSVFAVAYLVLRAVLGVAGVVAFGSAGLVVSIFFLAGVQLLTIGVLGEYVGRVFDEVTRRPLYLVGERTDGSTEVIPPSRPAG